MKVYYDYEITGEDTVDKFLNLLYEKYKYQIMWELRHFEEEIMQDGGQIIIICKDGKSGIQVKEFSSQELVDKIRPILQSVKIEHF